MKLLRLTPHCLTLFLIVQFTACTGAKKDGDVTTTSRTARTDTGFADSASDGAKKPYSIITGEPEICGKIITLDQKYKKLFTKLPADIKKNPAEMERVKTMLTDMEKIAQEFPSFSCILSEEGEEFVYDSEKHLAVLGGLKKQFKLKSG